tara:strand:+ start:443 stop:571 length:129 start_codon:yes stop_codon:yes gene_type:complete
MCVRSGATIVVATDAAVLGLASAQVALLLRPPPTHSSRCMTT